MLIQVYNYHITLFPLLAPADYTALNQVHTFTASGGSTKCSSIHIVPDGTVEGIEFFLVQLMSSTHPQLLGSVTSSGVTINDNDSKSNQ